MWAEGPRVVNVDLVVYDVTVGKGTDDDPMRRVSYIGLPDGTKLCRYSQGDGQVFPQGFNRVFSVPSLDHEGSTDG